MLPRENNVSEGSPVQPQALATADDADVLDSIGGSPFAQQPEPFTAPRLGIIHLLAWTAVTAVLLKIYLAAGYFELPSEEFSKAERIYSYVRMTLLLLLVSASVVGTAAIFLSKLRGATGRLQPGHWLVVIYAFITVLTLPAWILIFVYKTQLEALSGNAFFYLYYFLYGGINLLFAFLCLIATIRIKDAFRWKFMLGFFVFTSVMKGFLYFSIVLSFSLYKLAMLPIEDVLIIFILPVVVTIDLARRAQRDWIHWLGIAGVLIGAIMRIGEFIALKLFY